LKKNDITSVSTLTTKSPKGLGGLPGNAGVVKKLIIKKVAAAC